MHFCNKLARRNQNLISTKMKLLHFSLLFLMQWQFSFGLENKDSFFDHLFTDYIKEVRPFDGPESKVIVKFNLAAISINEIQNCGILKGHFWLRFVWHDPR